MHVHLEKQKYLPLFFSIRKARCNRTTNRITKVYVQEEKRDVETHSFQTANDRHSSDRLTNEIHAREIGAPIALQSRT